MKNPIAYLIFLQVLMCLAMNNTKSWSDSSSLKLSCLIYPKFPKYLMEFIHLVIGWPLVIWRKWEGKKKAGREERKGGGRWVGRGQGRGGTKERRAGGWERKAKQSKANACLSGTYNWAKTIDIEIKIFNLRLLQRSCMKCQLRKLPTTLLLSRCFRRGVVWRCAKIFFKRLDCLR